MCTAELYVSFRNDIWLYIRTRNGRGIEIYCSITRMAKRKEQGCIQLGMYHIRILQYGWKE